MGEVYRARDTRLERSVALKILPPHLSDGADARQRFEREARAISTLSHPNICALYDVGQHNGISYLVMEFLEGETLADRLKNGPLPLERALKHAIEISEALDKAHRCGVIHRDLKPSNIMLTKTGAKLMDFGLAKQSENAPVLEAATQDALEQRKLTAEGTILGTLQYMAPEQLEAGTIDARTDIFALGEVIYEMVTGKPAFQARSRASLIAAILSSQPQPLRELQPQTPPALEKAVKKCLAKDPDERWQNVSDFGSSLCWIADDCQRNEAEKGASRPSRSLHRMAWAVAAVAIILALSLGAVLIGSRPSREQTVYAFLPAPAGTSFQIRGDFGAPPMISPDGSAVVFAASGSLWLRSLRDGSAYPLAGTQGATFPFWSPDSSKVGFFADGRLKIMEVSGGPAFTVCAVTRARGGSWTNNGEILFAPDTRAGIFRVAAAGGNPVKITSVDTSVYTTHRWPFALPDGKHFLYLAANHINPKSETAGVYFASLDGKENRKLLTTYGQAIFVSGYLLFLRDAALMAQAFDPAAGILKGEAVPIVQAIDFYLSTWWGNFTASQNGTLVYEAPTGAHGTRLVWFDRNGREAQVLSKQDFAEAIRLSHSGARAAVILGNPDSDLWLFDLNDGNKSRFTFDGLVSNPVWSPDDRQIAYHEDLPDGKGALHLRRADGSGPETNLREGNDLIQPTDWSPDGRLLLADRVDSSGFRIWAIPIAGPQNAYPFLSAGGLHDARFAAGGKWVAYTSSDDAQIYVVPFPGPGGKWQVSTEGGKLPRWRKDGRELFYVTPDNMVTAAQVNGTGASFRVEQTRPLFRINLAAPSRLGAEGFDVSADGNRFLVAVAEDEKSVPLTLVSHWPAKLHSK